MPVTDQFDLAHRDELSRPWDQQQLMRDQLVRRARAEQVDAMRSAFRTELLRLWRAATFGSDAMRLFAGCCAAAVVRWWRMRAERAACRKAVAQLEGMSDRELWDIGLRRSEIHWAAHHGRSEKTERPPARSAAPSRPTPTPARPDASHRRDDSMNHRKHAA